MLTAPLELPTRKIDGLNATVNVGYEDECNGVSFTNQYTGQILVKRWATDHRLNVARSAANQESQRQRRAATLI